MRLFLVIYTQISVCGTFNWSDRVEIQMYTDYVSWCIFNNNAHRRKLNNCQRQKLCIFYKSKNRIYSSQMTYIAHDKGEMFAKMMISLLATSCDATSKSKTIRIAPIADKNCLWIIRAAVCGKCVCSSDEMNNEKNMIISQHRPSHFYMFGL